MSSPEQQPASSIHERQPFDTSDSPRRQRARHLGDQAMNSYTFLPEVETGHTREREYLQRRIIQQDEAIDAIISALDRSGVRNKTNHRPIASLAFLGPTGVGKTETAKALSEILAVDNPNIVRIDSSSYSHGHEMAALIGAPPGYVGREQTPILSSKRITSGSVLLFDEIEKGSPPLTNLLLQIMDNGLLELNDGSVTSFRNVAVIITSNLGASEMARETDGKRTGFSAGAAPQTDRSVIKAAALKGFKDFFSPEFVNRLDSMVVFHRLNENALYDVLDVKMQDMNATYIDEYGAYINVSDVVRKYLVAQALQQPEYGARPLVRGIEKELASKFGRYVAHNKIPEGTEVYAYHRSEIHQMIAEGYSDDIIFATRPDPTIRKRPVVQPSFLDPIDKASSTDLTMYQPGFHNED